MVLLEIAARTGGVHVVRNRGTAMPDGEVQNLDQIGEELFRTYF
jgi:hypothetical protein